MSAPALSGVIVTEPIIRARLRKAHDKQYRGGVLGLRARPVWDGRDFDYDGSPVTVVACPSVLAIWEAIEARAADRWTVVLTNVDDDDLGDTVLAHLLDGRLITPDPWDALGGNFSAATIEWLKNQLGLIQNSNENYTQYYILKENWPRPSLPCWPAAASPTWRRWGWWPDCSTAPPTRWRWACFLATTD